VLIGTGPPGPLVNTVEQLFYDTARIPENTFDEQVILFFEPRSQASRAAARSSVDRIARRQTDQSVPVPIEFATAALGTRPRNPMFPADSVLAALKSTSIPILHVGGDHDISFPVENWYALNQDLPTLQLLTFPRARAASSIRGRKRPAHRDICSGDAVGTRVITTVALGSLGSSILSERCPVIDSMT
jgi:pimeloyl-ACP methyl ester carboxylesterase